MAPLRRILSAGPRLPWEPESTRENRQRRVLPFVGLVMASLVVVALPPGGPERFYGLYLAAVGFLGIGALIVLLPWQRMPHWPRLGIVALYCADVALVRESTGGSRSGFSIMLLLVVVWMAAYGSRSQMAVAVAMTVVANIAPVVLIGGDRYPLTELRRTLLFTVVASVIGVVVHELVRRTTQERWVVGRVADFGRKAGRTTTRADVCAAAVELTGAHGAVLFEPLGDSVRVTGCGGVAIPAVTLPADLVPDVVRRAIASGEEAFVPDVRELLDHNTDASSALGVRSWFHQPAAIAGGATRVVLSVAWATPQRKVPGVAALALPLLAIEAAGALDRAELVDRLDAMTRQDPLTGLLNRRGWDDTLGRELARVGRSGRPLSVAILDLDRFKAFNDAHGHVVGDQLLKGAASAWSSVMRGSDVLARWGGEEFVVLMPETDTREAELVMARMAARTPMDQTFSAGIVTVTTRVDPDALVAAADAAVYRAKANGRDRVEIADAPVPVGLTVDAD